MRGIAAFAQRTAPAFVELDEPRHAPPGHVLCRTLHLGVCGTDREILASQAPWVPPGAGFLVLGHECLARVEVVGEEAQGLAPGDLVVPVVRRPRGAASRRVDLAPFGEYTERGIAYEHGFSAPLWLDRPEFLFAVPEELFELAVLAEPLSVAAKGIHEALVIQRARLEADVWTDVPPRVLVTGLGPIALAAVVGATLRGWPTTVYGRDEPGTFRAQLAREFGAEYLPAAETDFSRWDAASEGFDLVLECTGSEEVIVRSSAALAPCGVMVWLGSSRTPRPANLNLAEMVRFGLLRNHVHLGSVNAAPRDFEDALARLAQLEQTAPETARKLITHRVRPEQSLQHYQGRQPQGIKTVVMFD